MAVPSINPKYLDLIDVKEFGQIVRQLRRARSLTQKELAIKCGFKDSFISHIESGNKGISPATITAIAHAFSLDPRFLLLLAIPKDEGDPDPDDFRERLIELQEWVRGKINEQLTGQKPAGRDPGEESCPMVNFPVDQSSSPD